MCNQINSSSFITALRVETVAPSGDHYSIDLVVPSSDHCCTETVPSSSDYYLTTELSPPSGHLHTKRT